MAADGALQDNGRRSGASCFLARFREYRSNQRAHWRERSTSSEGRPLDGAARARDSAAAAAACGRVATLSAGSSVRSSGSSAWPASSVSCSSESASEKDPVCNQKRQHDQIRDLFVVKQGRAQLKGNTKKKLNGENRRSVRCRADGTPVDASKLVRRWPQVRSMVASPRTKEKEDANSNGEQRTGRTVRCRAGETPVDASEPVRLWPPVRFIVASGGGAGSVPNRAPSVSTERQMCISTEATAASLVTALMVSACTAHQQS